MHVISPVRAAYPATIMVSQWPSSRAILLGPSIELFLYYSYDYNCTLGSKR